MKLLFKSQKDRSNIGTYFTEERKLELLMRRLEKESAFLVSNYSTTRSDDVSGPNFLSNPYSPISMKTGIK